MSELLLAERYIAKRLLRESSHSRVLVVAPRETPEQDVVLKIQRTVSPFTSPRSSFYGAAEDFFGPGAVGSLLEHEAAVLRQLSHPAIPPLLDAGMHQELPFLVIPFYAGVPLHQVEVPLPIDKVLRVTDALLRALHHAHSRGVIHRDLSCRNVLLREDEAQPILLLDFELATAQGRGVRGRVGSLAYRAPEVTASYFSSHAQVDHRADLYALGVILYRLLSGRLPFPDRDQCAAAHAVENPVSLSSLRLDLPPPLDRFVQTLLAKQPEARFATAREALQALAHLSSGAALPPPDTARAPVVNDPASLSCAEKIQRSRELASLGRYSLALPESAQAAELARLQPDRALRMHALVQQMHLSVQLGLHPKTLAFADEAERICRGHAHVAALLGWTLTQLARPEPAHAQLVLAMESAPTLDSRALFLISQGALALGDGGLAIAAALRAHALAASSTPDGVDLLAWVAGQLLVLASENPESTEHSLPLLTACVQLALRELALHGSWNKAVAFARRGQQVGQRALQAHGAAPFWLQLAVCHWLLGDKQAIDHSLDQASEGVALDRIVAKFLEQRPGYLACMGWALRSCEQQWLAQYLVTQADTLAEFLEPLA